MVFMSLFRLSMKKTTIRNEKRGNIRYVPSGRLKTAGSALGFQHFPRDLANVNEWKIMFDPSIRMDDFFYLLPRRSISNNSLRQ